jgi:hypothetical protein
LIIKVFTALFYINFKTHDSCLGMNPIETN